MKPWVKIAQVASIALAALMAGAVLAEPLGFDGGHIKYQGSLLDEKSTTNFDDAHFVDARLKALLESNHWNFETHLQYLGVNPNTASISRSSGASFTQLPNDDSRLLRLTVADEDATWAQALRLDRLVLSREFGSGSVAVGRQAYSLGNGLAFSVLDVFNPFSPIAVDKDYKAGDDIAHIKADIFAAGATEAVVAVRRDPADGAVDDGASSAAAVQRARIDSLATDLLVVAGAHRGDGLAGFGVTRDALGATLRADVALQGSLVSGLANIDRGFDCLQRNCYGFVEIFHSGFGARQDALYLPKSDRDERIAAGDLYTLGKNYVSVGGRVEISPLVNAFVTHIVGLQDESSLGQFRVVWDVVQNVVVQFGATIPLGGRGDEFGNPPSALADTLPNRAAAYFARVEFYF